MNGVYRWPFYMTDLGFSTCGPAVGFFFCTSDSAKVLSHQGLIQHGSVWLKVHAFLYSGCRVRLNRKDSFIAMNSVILKIQA